MSSARKTFGIIITVSIIAYIALTLSDHFTNNDSEILEQIEFDAVYLKNEQIVEISFIDKSTNTKTAILEVLGMEKTYHQEFLLDNEDGFVDRMRLNQLPEYGWKTIPVTLEIDHYVFGKFGLKTEIHTPEESKPEIILEQKST